MTILEQIQLCLRARHSLIYLISNDELAIDRLVEQLRPNYQSWSGTWRAAGTTNPLLPKALCPTV